MKTILSTVRREDTNRKKSNEQLEKKLLAVVKKENDALCERMNSLQRIADIDSTVVRSKRGRHCAADPWEHKRREKGDGSTQQPSQELIVAAADRNLFWVEDFFFHVCFRRLAGIVITTKWKNRAALLTWN